MKPEIWGKYGWSFLHLVTMAYPTDPTDEDKQHYYDYFHALKYVLPCNKCCYNMAGHMKKFPLTTEVLSSRKNLVKWGIDLHNVVNYYTGKEMLSYADAMNEINKLINKPTDYSNYVYYALIIIAIIIILFLCYYYLRKYLVRDS